MIGKGISLHYLDSLTLEDTALRCGMSSKQAVKEAEERALDRLAPGFLREPGFESEPQHRKKAAVLPLRVEPFHRMRRYLLRVSPWLSC